MSFEGDFLHMMIPGVSHRGIASRDAYGAPVAGNVTNIVGHVTYRKKVVRTDVESNVMSTATVIIPPPGFIVNGISTPQVSDGDELQLGGDGVYRHVIEAITYTDEQGPHHQTLMLA